MASHRIVLASVGSVPPSQRLDLYQGTTFKVEYQFFEDDNTTPLDITGYQFALQIRKTPSTATAYTPAVPVFDDAANGKMHWLFVGALVAQIPCGDLPTSPRSKYVWDFQSVSPSGHETALRRGDVVIWAQVTRDGAPVVVFDGGSASTTGGVVDFGGP